MAANFNVSVEGLADLEDAFRQLRAEVQEKVGRAAVSAAAKVVRDKAVQNVQARGLRETGALEENIATRRVRNPPPGRIEYHVLVRAGRRGKKPINNPWYWFMLEFGTLHIAPQSFMRQAAQTEAQAAASVIRDRLAASIKRIARRKAKRARLRAAQR